ncbi:cell division protein ZapC, partial [Plesiomonas shigelloides]|nr:cell division protein ZapC [Plesiomonas shigelloides]
MKIKPDDRWTWYFDAEFDRLMPELANGMVFRSLLAGSFLIADIFSGCAFTVEVTAQYYDYMDELHASPLTSAQKAELVLNAVAAPRFLQ